MPEKRVVGLFVVLSLVTYTTLFFALLTTAGEKVTILSLIPIIVIALFYGLKAGVVAAILLAAVNAVFFLVVGLPGFDIMFSYIPGILASCILGAAIGFTSDLYKKNKRTLNELSVEREILKKEISIRKKAEEQIIIMERALNSTMNSVVITDPRLPDNPVIYANPAFERITGYKKEEILGKNCRILQGPGTSQETVSELREAIKNEHECNVVILNYRKDGKPFWSDVSISPVKDAGGELINFVGIKSDITERMIAEAALRENEIRYRNVVDNVKEVIFQTDADGNWTFLNFAWEEITGFSIQESLGKLFLDYVHPDDRERNSLLFMPLINREKDYNRHTIRYLTKDGGFKWIEVFARVTLDEAGNVIGTSGTLNDVTYRKKADEDIKQSILKEKELNEMKSRFVSTISHEFRTPLTSILASNELLQRYYHKWTDEKKIDTLKRIEKSVEYMNEMINDVLTLNRADSGRLEFKPAPTDLITLSKNILEEVKLTAKPSHQFIFEYEGELNNVSLDEKLVRNIIVNLLSNSVKYSPNGGKIKFFIIKKPENIEIIVEDEGIGISEEDQKKLFQPFIRGTNIENIPGTGLGLTILQRAVSLHKGKISLTSELGKGTKFFILLPGAHL
jgi:PAS domain S-box-containing protein